MNQSIYNSILWTILTKDCVLQSDMDQQFK